MGRLAREASRLFFFASASRTNLIGGGFHVREMIIGGVSGDVFDEVCEEVGFVI